MALRSEENGTHSWCQKKLPTHHPHSPARFSGTPGLQLAWSIATSCPDLTSYSSSVPRRSCSARILHIKSGGFLCSRQEPKYHLPSTPLCLGLHLQSTACISKVCRMLIHEQQVLALCHEVALLQQGLEGTPKCVNAQVPTSTSGYSGDYCCRWVAAIAQRLLMASSVCIAVDLISTGSAEEVASLDVTVVGSKRGPCISSFVLKLQCPKCCSRCSASSLGC